MIWGIQLKKTSLHVKKRNFNACQITAGLLNYHSRNKLFILMYNFESKTKINEDSALFTCFGIKERPSSQTIDPGRHRCPRADWHTNRITQIRATGAILVCLFMILYLQKKLNFKWGEEKRSSSLTNMLVK